jgi:hypothetical protein
MNTLRSTRMIGRAAMVALLVAPFATASAQLRRDDNDRIVIADARRDDAELRREEIERRRDQERRLFTWRGVVDDDTRIYIRAGNVQSDVVSGVRTRREPRVDRDRALPRRDGALRVQLLEGRGRVQVIQQPSARNNYTAIVRVKDAQRGADTYRFATFFDPEDDYRNDGWDDRGDIWGDGGSGQRVMRWRGTVDGDVRISLRGSSVGYVVASGDQPRGVNASGSLPRRDGLLSVSLHQGRGTVSIIQHPSSYNNYTAVVRVSDPQGSYGYYDFDLVWR